MLSTRRLQSKRNQIVASTAHRALARPGSLNLLAIYIESLSGEAFGIGYRNFILASAVMIASKRIGQTQCPQLTVLHRTVLNEHDVGKPAIVQDESYLEAVAVIREPFPAWTEVGLPGVTFVQRIDEDRKTQLVLQCDETVARLDDH